jgi:hypothetical protein
MIPRSARSVSPAFLALAMTLGSMQHCAPRTVDAVELGPTQNGPTQSTARTSVPDAASALVWPNATSAANSDPWLVAHDDDLVEMHPRVVVLHFYNGFDVTQTLAIAQAQIDAIAEGSRYHGYLDAAAPPFLRYELLKVVDLADHPPPANWPYASSTQVPTDSSGAFDTAALFSRSFAINYGFPDPSSPARFLTLCELFERGVINELWLEVEDGARAPGLMMESKQVYDGQNRPVAGAFESCAGYACLPSVHCSVTARIAHLSPTRGPGCDLLVRQAGLENTRLAIPYLQANARDFINHDFMALAGTRFDSFEELCAAQMSVQPRATGSVPGGQRGTTSPPACVNYPSQDVAQGMYSDGTRWRIAPFIQGCGTSHFPANARYRWDYDNSQPVQSRCEHYRMRDGAGSSDLFDVYTSSKVAHYTQRYGDDCGGGWQVYLRQNVPGLHNAAYAVDGAPMKNWWPLLFY